jgi:hypothetical protein
MVLDSGASHLVLFGHEPSGSLRTAWLDSHHGTRIVLTSRIPRIEIGDRVFKGKLAALLPSEGRQENGLLPMNLFDSIYVDAERGFVLLPK